MAAASPDAELIAACTAFIAAQERADHIYDEMHLSDDEADALARPHFDGMSGALDLLDKLRAKTAAGVVARALALAVHNGNNQASFEFGDRTHTSRLLAGLLVDTLTLTGRPIPDELAREAGITGAQS